MRHIVICWELGEGLGHLVSMSKIVEELTRQGYKVTCILKDITMAHKILGRFRTEWLAAPRIYLRNPIPAPINHAEVLFNTGYRDADSIASLLIGWRTIFSALKPDRIICEYAPTAGLAGKALGIDVICIDSGFSTPPLRVRPDDRLPPIRHTPSVTEDRLRESELNVLGMVNRARWMVGDAELVRFSDIFNSKVLYRNWTEFNHFGMHSPELHMGQIFGDSGGVRPEWPANGLPRVFAYLKPNHPESLPVLRAALACGYQVVAYLPGFPDSVLSELCQNPRIMVSPLPFNLNELPEDIQLGIWHSATGGIARCLDKGMRMIFLPMHPEQYLAAMAVRGAGLPAYVSVNPEAWPAVFQEIQTWPRHRLNNCWKPADIEQLAHRLVNS